MMWIPLIRTFAHQWIFLVPKFQENPPEKNYEKIENCICGCLPE
jgi:hypothetical protein